MKFSIFSRRLALASAVVTLTLASAAYAAYSFGYPGSDGYDGSPGQNGRSGQDVQIQALGQSETFNLQGSDGTDGSDGSYGSDATGCWSGTPDYDLYGASGGDGGDGGDAGIGGSGGSIRVYYKDLTNLKKIYVDSTPGVSGRAGRGAAGGNGCRCSTHYWTNRLCHEESRQVTVYEPAGCSPGTEGCNARSFTEYYQVCNDYSFSCQDGSSGSYGRSGGGEIDGRYGNIQLVNRLEPLEATSPSLSAAMQSLTQNQYELTRHEWDAKTGSQVLFASGSKIRDDYSHYAGKTVKHVLFKWQDTVRPTEYYRGESVSLALVGKPAQTSVSFPHSILVDSVTTVENDTTYVDVKRSMKREELTQIKVEDLVGSGLNLELVLIDDANVSDISTTKIFIKSDWDLEAGGEFENWVPENLIRVEQVGNQQKIHVNIGRIPGIKAKKMKDYFSEDCEFEMKIMRDFVGNTERVVRDGGNVFDIEKDLKKRKPIKVEMENKYW